MSSLATFIGKFEATRVSFHCLVQDSEEITNVELADAFEQMWSKRRYNEIFFMIDTCQATSMYARFYSPNILAVGSSLVGEDSLSHHVDPAIGVYIIDR